MQQTYEELFRLGTGELSRIINIDNGPARRPFFWRKRTRKAIEVLRRCVAIEPKSWPCMWYIGKAYQALGDHPAALQAFTEAADFPHGNPDVFREATIEACKVGDGQVAMTMADRAIAASPDNAGLLANLALASLVAHDLARANAAADAALQLAPNDPVSHNVARLVRAVVEGRKPCPARIP